MSFKNADDWERAFYTPHSVAPTLPGPGAVKHFDKISASHTNGSPQCEFSA